jgi:hypothetical protein
MPPRPVHRLRYAEYPGDLSLTYPAFLVSGPNVVGVGGNFAIAANQPNGLYTGTFTVTAQYP